MLGDEHPPPIGWLRWGTARARLLSWPLLCSAAGVAACGGRPGPTYEAQADADRAAYGRPAAGEADPGASGGGEADREASYEATYRAARELADGPLPQGPALERIRGELAEVANRARDRHLRANAAVLLASIEERVGRIEPAISLLRHARALVADDPGPAMALAVVLGRAGRFDEAARIQAEAAELDPDNLENWLLLGEFRTKAGDRDGAVEAYAAYELRRKGLLDGLTLRRKDGTYLRPPEERAACARALAAATDQGTARGLLYALAHEPEPEVRRAIVETMAVMRLADFVPALRRALERESDPGVRAAMEAAVAHIEADPVSPAPERVAPSTTATSTTP
ncbi:MAG: hypothetical protein D6705_09335 [Deltaproteobacteria bacterium]|nr:MAG: hypothetical protein D6705_09335 [Deltaproteobacteria bacterium]